MMPVIMNYMRWVPINSIRTAVPITSDEGNREGIKKEGFILEGFKKFKMVRRVCMGIHVHDLENMATNRHLGTDDPTFMVKSVAF